MPLTVTIIMHASQTKTSDNNIKHLLLYMYIHILFVDSYVRIYSNKGLWHGILVAVQCKSIIGN